MQIPIQTPVLIEFARGDKMKSEYIGGAKDEFVLLRVPSSPGVRDKCRDGNMITCRFLHKGTIVGFRAKILHYVATPHSLVFVDYPRDFETHSLRKTRRIDCNFPATINMGGKSFEGVILDISEGGCKFSCETLKRNTRHLTPDTPFSGEFRIMDREKTYPFSGVLAKVTAGEHKSLFGLKFKESDEPLRKTVKGYIDEVIKLLEG